MVAERDFDDKQRNVGQEEHLIPCVPIPDNTSTVKVSSLEISVTPELNVVINFASLGLTP